MTTIDTLTRTIARHGVLAGAVVAFLVPLATFFPSLRGDLVYDDHLLILVDDFLHKPEHFGDILTLRILTMDVVDWYRPMSLLSLMLDAWIWGRDPFGYHLTSVSMHAVNSVLVFLVLVNVSRRVLGVTESGRTAAALCSSVALALCFALHPLTTEAVCVATFREDLLVALFTLSSLLVLDRALDKERRAPALIAIGFLQLLAVTSKESGIALAPAAIVYWLTFCRRESRLFAAGLAAVCGVVIGVFVFVRFTMGPATTQVYQKAGSLAPTLAEWLPVQTRIWMQQVRCVVDTRQLSIWYPLESIRTAPAIGSLLVVGGVVSACLLTAWKLPQSRFGLVLIAAAMLPVSNLAPLYVPIADRFLYLPLAGAALAAGGSALALAVKFSSARSLWILTTAVLVVLPFLATATVRREAVFATSVKLWQDAESKYPGSIHVARSLAVFHLLAGDYAEAARRFELVVKRQPLMWDHAGLAIAAYERGDRASAKAHLAEAVKLDTSLRSIDTLPSGSLVRILGVQRVAAMLDEFGLR